MDRDIKDFNIKKNKIYNFFNNQNMPYQEGFMTVIRYILYDLNPLYTHYYYKNKYEIIEGYFYWYEKCDFCNSWHPALSETLDYCDLCESKACEKCMKDHFSKGDDSIFLCKNGCVQKNEQSFSEKVNKFIEKIDLVGLSSEHLSGPQNFIFEMIQDFFHIFTCDEDKKKLEIILNESKRNNIEIRCCEICNEYVHCFDFKCRICRKQMCSECKSTLMNFVFINDDFTENYCKSHINNEYTKEDIDNWVYDDCTTARFVLKNIKFC